MVRKGNRDECINSKWECVGRIVDDKATNVKADEIPSLEEYLADGTMTIDDAVDRIIKADRFTAGDIEFMPGTWGLEVVDWETPLAWAVYEFFDDQAALPPKLVELLRAAGITEEAEEALRSLHWAVYEKLAPDGKEHRSQRTCGFGD